MKYLYLMFYLPYSSKPKPILLLSTIISKTKLFIYKCKALSFFNHCPFLSDHTIGNHSSMFYLVIDVICLECV